MLHETTVSELYRQTIVSPYPTRESDLSYREVRDVPRIFGLFNILTQKLQSLLLYDLLAPRNRFDCRRGRDVQFFRLIPLAMIWYSAPGAFMWAMRGMSTKYKIYRTCKP
jgi:hypothetical protein